MFGEHGTHHFVAQDLIQTPQRGQPARVPGKGGGLVLEEGEHGIFRKLPHPQ